MTKICGLAFGGMELSDLNISMPIPFLLVVVRAFILGFGRTSEWPSSGDFVGFYLWIAFTQEISWTAKTAIEMALFLARFARPTLVRLVITCFLDAASVFHAGPPLVLIPTPKDAFPMFAKG